MITVLAEKFDIGAKIAAALQGIDCEGKHITINNISENAKLLEQKIKPKGVIYITYQGNKYAITWAQGHLCELKQAKDYNPDYKSWKNIPFPFFPEYEIRVKEKVDYKTRKKMEENDPWCERQLGIIDKLFQQSEYIINATDDDREGELIFSYIYQYVNSHVPYKKLRLDSQTQEAIVKAFANLIDSSKVQPIETAGRLRAISDWIVGANISGLATLKYKKYVPEMPMITVGRIQTAVLNFIVTRERAIKNFVSHPFWRLEGIFTTADGKEYVGKHVLGQIEDKAKADALFSKVNGKNGIITSCEQTPLKREVPLLYDFLDIAKEANHKWGYSTNDTLKICQDLYEKGYTTYPRTDCKHLTSDMQPVVDGVLEMLSGFNADYKKWIDAVPVRNYSKRHFDSTKVTSHFAIIPTNVRPVGLTEQQSNIYDLVAKSVIRIIYKAASGEKTSIVTTVEGEDFKTIGTVILDPQWLVVGDYNIDKDTLPIVHEKDAVSGSYELKEGKTEPPKRYTEETLVIAMQTASTTIDDEELREILKTCNEGKIGRPSSTGSIIKNVVDRYCYMKGKSIVPTEAGMKMLDMLPIEDIKSPVITAEWEQKLNLVEKGQITYQDYLSQMESTVEKWCKTIKEDESVYEIPQMADTHTTDIMCPRCGKPMRKFSWGWSCSGYEKDNPNSCDFAVRYNLSGALLKDKDIESLILNGKTRYINGFKSKDGKTYGCYLALSEEKKLSRTWESPYECPKCGKHYLEHGSKAFSCPDKAGCGFILWKSTFNKELKTSEITALLEGKSVKVKGLVKKNGDTFDAELQLSSDWKIEFANK